MSASTLEQLPFDVVDCITGYLTIRDYVALSRVNHKFWKDLKNEGSAKRCLQINVPESTEAKDASRHGNARRSRRCLDNIYSRSESLSTASPYSATLLGNATSFVFDGDIVCYSTTSPKSGEIRILDLRRAPRIEKVIDSRYLVQKVADPGELVSLDNCSLTITDFKCSIVTLVCDFGPSKGSYLFAVNVAENVPTRRIILCEALRSTNKIFTRHNSQYLYYGTHSATGSDGYREWLIQGFDLQSGKPITQQPIQLCNFAGSDSPGVVDFTLYKGSFYAISNQFGFESEEINWTSYYCYVCFPLDSTETTVKLKTIWRRQDVEGPINDSWTCIFFDTDKITGELLIMEIRKEWPNGTSSQVRTCYMQPWSTAKHGDWDERATTNTADRLALAVDKDDKPRFEADAPPRIDKYRHYEFRPGYAGEKLEYIHSKTKWSHYSYSNHAFVDLVVDDVEVAGSWRPKERLRLRVVSRAPSSPLEDAFGQLNLRKKTSYKDEPVEASGEAFTESKVFKWPPVDVQLPDELENMMCPGGKAGEVKAVLGDRGIVYMAGPANDYGQRSLLYLSFDPAFGFEGMKRLDGSLARPKQRERDSQQDKSSNVTALKRASASSISSVGDCDGELGVKRLKTATSASTIGDGEKASGRSAVAFGKEEVSRDEAAPSLSKVNEQEGDPVSGKVIRERLLYKTKAKYLGLQEGWWLR